MKSSETELYLPVKTFFEDIGFSVKGEVKSCDLMAVREDIIIICELKLSFSLKLLYQLMDRKALTENVYAVIPRPKKGHNTKEWKNIVKLLKALDMGLITVTLDSPIKTVEVILEPFDGKSYKNKKRQAILKNEFSNRILDGNIGGVNRKKILTAYMEKSILVLCALDSLVKSSPKNVKAICNEDKTATILLNNVYGWFLREGKGVYSVSDKGREFLNSCEYKDVKEYYKKYIEDRVL